MSSMLYTYCYHSLHHFPSPTNTEVLAQMVEYDLNLHMQIEMPFSNQPFYSPMVPVQKQWISKILTVISLGDLCLHPGNIILTH